MKCEREMPYSAEYPLSGICGHGPDHWIHKPSTVCPLASAFKDRACPDPDLHHKFEGDADGRPAR